MRIVDLEGNTLGRTIYPVSFTVMAFILVKLWMGGTIRPLRLQKTKTKPDLDRVKRASQKALLIAVISMF